MLLKCEKIQLFYYSVGDYNFHNVYMTNEKCIVICDIIFKSNKSFETALDKNSSKHFRSCQYSYLQLWKVFEITEKFYP